MVCTKPFLINKLYGDARYLRKTDLFENFGDLKKQKTFLTQTPKNIFA